jgi:hypothetical protein
MFQSWEKWMYPLESNSCKHDLNNYLSSVDFPQKYPTHLIQVKWKTMVANKVKEPWQGKPRDLVLVQHGRNH